MRHLLLPLLLLVLPALGAGPLPNYEAGRRRAVAEATVTFPRYVFEPIADPKEQPDLIGYSANLRPMLALLPDALVPVTVGEAKSGEGKAGPIGWHISFLDRNDRTLARRFVTTYRAAQKVPDDRKFGDDHAALAKAMGLDKKVVERNAELVKRVLRDRTYGEWSRDPQAARLLAGLYLSKPAGGKGPARKWEDAFAVERQWWVDLKRARVYPGEKFYLDKPFVCPNPIKEDKPYAVVREGTEKEAGVLPGTAEKIDAALRAFEKDTDEAFAVCIVRNGVIVLHKAYGTRDGKAMTLDTPSWMASVTKPMAAVLMLMLLDQGLVKLDDPVEKYLPPLRGIRTARPPLTIHHLYTHTNGLTLDGYPGWNDEMPDVAERIAAYYDLLRVGQTWAYTGTGNILGGKIIEMITGEAIPQFYHAHLLSPLGMTNTHVTDTHAGAFSVPLDVAKFGQMLLNKGAYGDRRFFSEKTFTDVMLPKKLDALLGEGTTRTFGFGLDGNRERFGHGAASAATFHVDTSRRLVVVMTRNRYGKNQDKYNGLFWKAIDEGIPKK